MNKVILFLVEGPTDETSIGLTLTRTLKEIKFHVIHTDLTTDKESTIENVESKVSDQIAFFLAERPHLTLDDIDMIIQISDTDGAFVDDDCVIQNKECTVAYYSANSISISDPINIQKRNKQKAEILNVLYKKKYIECEYNGVKQKVKYRIYYMSCNLEHVLHNKQNCTREDKVELSRTFRQCCNRKHDYLRDILFSPAVDNSTSFLESWEYIKKENNSLCRKSNFSYFFREFIDEK